MLLTPNKYSFKEHAKKSLILFYKEFEASIILDKGNEIRKTICMWLKKAITQMFSFIGWDTLMEGWTHAHCAHFESDSTLAWADANIYIFDLLLV